jgi:hypothetical protein
MLQHRRSALTLAGISVVALVGTTLVRGSSASDRQSPAKTWTVGRTPDGQPDLQGVWTNYDPTPFERLTADERSPQGPAVSTQDWLVQDSPVSPRRPSMVVDPPDGRVPLRREAVERRNRDLSQPADSLEHYGPWERCITRGVPSSLFPGAYNNGHQIVQTAKYFVIHSEMIHEARVIPLDGRPHLDPAITSWEGDSRGRWEGDTLVVDTTNFNGKSWIATNAAAGRMRGIPQSERCHLVERFTRVDASTIQYSVTIDDPNVFTRPWTAAFPLNRDDKYQLFEYACHEANYALGNMLRMGTTAKPR